ncbi:MAG TPA: hypothetical protein VE595_00490 [Nitrososphaeraceae archaeon]|nr:hypothetical protein [Nitrososphaeraceae archaeon]
MRKLFLIISFSSLILVLLLLNSANVMSVSGGNSNNMTTFTNNKINLDISNLVYDINSKPFNV